MYNVCIGVRLQDAETKLKLRSVLGSAEGRDSQVLYGSGHPISKMAHHSGIRPDGFDNLSQCDRIQ